MKFCPKCKGLILPKKNVNGDSVYECKCGYTEIGGDTKFTTATKTKDVQDIDVPTGDVDERLPKCKEECEKCSNKEAYFWELQTRASDEPPTRFFKCTKCKHTWRDYT